MDFAGQGTPISESGFKGVLTGLGVEAAALWAMLRVETSGAGFLPDRRPQILFERHVFARFTGGKFNQTAPDISNPVAGGYEARGAHQYDRLEKAIALDREAALQSCSWGIGQVMGFHAETLGYTNVDDMVNAAVRSEDDQLKAVSRFLTINNLNKVLKANDWAKFAHGYNGPNYATNNYDSNLKKQYEQLLANGLPDLHVRAAQLYLRYAGLDPGPVDGLMGDKTRGAVRQFQQRSSLAVTGVLDDPTFTALLGESG